MTRHPQPNPYAILGITPDATSAEITRAYRRLLRTHHPDTHQATPPDPQNLAALLDAYQLLRDPHRRTAYDREHTPTPQTNTHPAPTHHQHTTRPPRRTRPLAPHPIDAPGATLELIRPLTAAEHRPHPPGTASPA